jgi:hypothetical protein
MLLRGTCESRLRGSSERVRSRPEIWCFSNGSPRAFVRPTTVVAMAWADSSGERRAAGGAGVAAAGSTRLVAKIGREVWGRSSRKPKPGCCSRCADSSRKVCIRERFGSSSLSAAHASRARSSAAVTGAAAPSIAAALGGQDDRAIGPCQLPPAPCRSCDASFHRGSLESAPLSAVTKSSCG